MGRNHRKVWQGKNCVLCGGNRPAETNEHSPPITLFLGETRPKGWEFPACKRCNNGTSSHDQLAAFVAYSQAPAAVFQSKPLSSLQSKLIDGFRNNSPFPYKRARAVPVYDQSTQTWKTARHAEFTDQAAIKLALWSAKQSLAMWYELTKTIASEQSVIDICLLTNSMHPDHEFEQTIHNIGPSFSMSTNRNFVGENFSYKFQSNSKKDLAVMFAQYHGGFAFVSIITDRPSDEPSSRGLQFKFATNGPRGIHELKGYRP